MRTLAPVVEVACDHQRRVARNHARGQIKQAFDLLLSVRFTQPQVHAYRMKLRCARNIEHTMQYSTRLGLANRYVDVLPFDDRVFRQQCVAVMAAGRYRIAPVGMLRPHLIGEDLVLMRRNLLAFSTANFLQKNQMGAVGTQLVTDLR